MLAKIQQFKTYSTPNEVLQTLSTLSRIFIERNGSNTDFNIYPSSDASDGAISEGVVLPVDFSQSNSIFNESCCGKLAKSRFTVVLPKLPRTVVEL